MQVGAGRPGRCRSACAPVSGGRAGEPEAAARAAACVLDRFAV